MKVAEQIKPPAPMPPVDRPPRPGGQAVSFAQILASGKSLDMIRAERALGFAETGLLGAGQAVDLIAQGAPMQKSAGQMPTRQAKIGSEKAPASKLHNVIARLTGENAHVDRAAMTFAGDSLKARFQISAKLSAAVLAVKSIFTEAEGPAAGPRATFENSLALPRRKKQPFSLSLSGDDDAPEIIARDTDLDNADASAFNVTFFTIAAHFGVTLKAVTLNGSCITYGSDSGRAPWL